MLKRLIPVVAMFALVGTPAFFSIGCDKEVSHDKVETKDSNGNSAKTETTVKEKSDGTVEKTTDKKVESQPGK